MADILEFRVKQATKSTTTATTTRAASAEIVIFPGIRYERWESAAPAPSALMVERDTLRLVE